MKWQLNLAQCYVLKRIKQLKAGASGPKTYVMTNATKWQLNLAQCYVLRRIKQFKTGAHDPKHI